MKRLVDEDRARARTLLEAYPQVVEALVQIQRRLGMIPTVSGGPMIPSGTSSVGYNVEQSNSAALSSSAMGNVNMMASGSGGFNSGGDPIQQAIQMARAQVTDFLLLICIFPSHIPFSPSNCSDWHRRRQGWVAPLADPQ